MGSLSLDTNTAGGLGVDTILPAKSDKNSPPNVTLMFPE